MKFLGSFIIFAILNLISVFAAPYGPPPAFYISDGDFKYYIPRGASVAIVKELINKQAKTVTVKPYVYNGQSKYEVQFYSADLAGSSVEKFIIPGSLTQEFHLSGSIGNAKNLKEIQIDAPNVIPANSFEKIDKNVSIYGKGVENMIVQYAKEMFKEKGITFPKYNASNINERQCTLFKIAKFMFDNFEYQYSCRYPENCDSGTHTILYKKGGEYGFARAFRILAIAAGYDRNAVLVGGDDMMFAFNYVEFNKKWYLIEVHANEYYYKNSNKCSSILSGSDAVSAHNGYYGKGVSLTDDVLTIYHELFFYEGEVRGPKQENFKQWLKKYNKGTLVQHYN
eukprot:jgi/Orpsp1_1/1177170/evm.model.c7180000060449.1